MYNRKKAVMANPISKFVPIIIVVIIAQVNDLNEVTNY